MDIKTSGGPMSPTMIGVRREDGAFQWEGMTLFDYYVGQFIAAGDPPSEAVQNAIATMELRNGHLIQEQK